MAKFTAEYPGEIFRWEAAYRCDVQFYWTRDPAETYMVIGGTPTRQSTNPALWDELMALPHTNVGPVYQDDPWGYGCMVAWGSAKFNLKSNSWRPVDEEV